MENIIDIYNRDNLCPTCMNEGAVKCYACNRIDTRNEDKEDLFEKRLIPDSRISKS